MTIQDDFLRQAMIQLLGACAAAHDTSDDNLRAHMNDTSLDGSVRDLAAALLNARVALNLARDVTSDSGAVQGRVRYTGDVELEWEQFWKDIVAPTGEIDVDQVKRELSDYSILLHNVPRVYMHVSGGRVSYPNVDFEVVCSLADEYVADCCSEAAIDDEAEAVTTLQKVYGALGMAAADRSPVQLLRQIEQLQHKASRTSFALGIEVGTMVNRFLGWQIPTTFSPDGGISFDGRKDDEWSKNKQWPVGTNLLNAEEAKAMFLHCLAAPADGDTTTREQYRRMFGAACDALGLVNEALDLDPDDGGAEPILDAIGELKAMAGANSAGARDVLAERQRQVSKEGYDAAHDDEHVNDEIAALAAYYVMPPATRDWPASETGYGSTWGRAIMPLNWVAGNTFNRRHELIKAGALVLAEIDRLDRAAGQLAGGEGG